MFEIIVEIGGAHKGNTNYLEELISDAIQAGSTHIKFQIYDPDSLVSRDHDPERHRHFEKLTIDPEIYIKIKNFYKTKFPKIKFGASIWSPKLINKYGYEFEFLKLGSGDMTYKKSIFEICKLKKPFYISTGLAYESEIIDTINFIERNNSDNLKGILYCKSSYPTPNEYLNLNCINRLQKIFPKYNIGYSHHGIGYNQLIVAFALGVRIMEVHFTKNVNDKSFRDNQLSFNHISLKTLYEDLFEIEKMLHVGNNSNLQPTIAEEINGNRIEFRRSAYAAKDLEDGSELKESDVMFLRPFIGICASRFEEIRSLRLKNKLKKGAPITWNDVELK